jgi:hypothetical protein
MSQPPQEETFNALRLRYTLLISSPSNLTNTEVRRLRSLSHIARLRADILRFHSQNREAMSLYKELAVLAKAFYPAHELLDRLQILLHRA